MAGATPLPFEHERIRSSLLTHRRRGSVTRVHASIIAESEKNAGDGTQERLVVAAGQVGPADRSCKERVADEQVLAGFAATADLQAYAAGTMTWCMVHHDVIFAEHQRSAPLVIQV